MKVLNGITAFWHKSDKLSNWYIRDYTVKNITFNCGEQAMMYAKAMFFNDPQTAQKILAEPEPWRQKKLGKEVKNFDNKKWDDNCERILAAMLLPKFLQHEDMKALLISTDGTELVEASEYDPRWGIGMSVNDPNFMDRSKWGENRLGAVLTRIRTYILKLERKNELNLDPMQP